MAAGSDHAVVIGAGIAGLLAAHALLERFGHVTVLDRDSLPNRPVPRVGVPQARHPHRIPDRGRRALDELVPGLTDDLVARGAPAGPGVSRSLLEWTVRHRLASSPQVRLLGRTAVLDLLWTPGGGRVVGVRSVSSDDPSTTPSTAAIEADLVVDASGRASRLGEWLHRAGHPEPGRRTDRVDLTVVTRRFRGCPRAECAGDVVAGSRPRGGRSAVAQLHEGGVWSVSLAGYHGDRPPPELGRFLAAAPSYGGSVLADVLDCAEPIDDAVTYRFPANRRRDLDRTPMPPGVLAVGDALCTLDPMLGQGIAMAALEALALRDHPPGPTLLRRTARLLDQPWSEAVSVAAVARRSCAAPA
jgi:2-polyprenyl-6-methoxyphenol hydroxylase-like FAD-dependent oxidoreductase